MPYGEKKLQSQALEIGAVERTHMGNYACTVDNTIEQPIVKNFRLEVNCEWKTWSDGRLGEGWV